MEKKKRTLVEIKNHVKVTSQKSEEGHVPINGPDLKEASGAIDLIPDMASRTMVKGLFMTFSKYQVLGMLLDDNGKWFQKYPEIMTDIAERATRADVAATVILGRTGG